jgi:hypothetical protein
MGFRGVENVAQVHVVKIPDIPLCIMAPHSTALKMSTDAILMTHTFMYDNLRIREELMTAERGCISASGH